MTKNLSNLLILLLVVVTVGTILVRQNPSSGAFILEELRLPKKTTGALDEETLASWKTYQKEGFPFEFKYPQSLAFKYDSVWEPESPLVRKTLNSIFEGVSFNLTVVVNAPVAQATTSKAELIREKAIRVNGVLAPNKIFREPNGDIISFISFEKNSNLYYVWASIVKDQNANLKTFDQIISTFRFLD
ncbi:MAG: hypothetical protein Q7S70_01520 [bacterium]|nr:hypothetical protein [bacterium]